MGTMTQKLSKTLDIEFGKQRNAKVFKNFEMLVDDDPKRIDKPCLGVRK